MRNRLRFAARIHISHRYVTPQGLASRAGGLRLITRPRSLYMKKTRREIMTCPACARGRDLIDASLRNANDWNQISSSFPWCSLYSIPSDMMKCERCRDGISSFSRETTCCSCAGKRRHPPRSHPFPAESFHFKTIEHGAMNVPISSRFTSVELVFPRSRPSDTLRCSTSVC